MEFKAIVSGHIWRSDSGKKDIEILTMVHNDSENLDVFCGIEDSLLDSISIGKEDDYYFIAIVESNIEEYTTWEGIKEYDVEHVITNVKTINDLNGR